MKRFLYIFPILLFSCTHEIPDTVSGKLDAPVEVSATSLSADALHFEWSEVKGADKYSWLLRDRHSHLVDMGITEVNSVDITQLVTGEKYTFAVRAAKGMLSSDYSAFIEGIPGGVYIPVKPDAPINVTCEVEELSALIFSWDSSEDAKYYNWTLEDDNLAEVRSGRSEGTSVTIDGLQEGMMYFFRVQAWNDGEASAYSSRTVGIAGQEYSGSVIRILFVSSSDGTIWNEGDCLSAEAEGRQARYICKNAGTTTGLFFLEKGEDPLPNTGVRALYPAGFEGIPYTADKGQVKPLAGISDGIRLTMHPLCAEVNIRIVSDKDRVADQIGITAEGKAMSGNAVIDWSSGKPSMSLEGDAGVLFDFSSEPMAVGSDTVVLRLLLPPGDYGEPMAVLRSGEEIASSPVLVGTLESDCEANCIFADPDDYYSIWRSGNAISLCGRSISRKTHPTVSLASAESINSALNTSGLHFVDNSGTLPAWSYSAARIKPIADGVVLIGRYKNYPQPVMSNSFGTANQGTFRIDGTVMLMNYRIETKDSGYGAFIGKTGVVNSGTQDLYFQDCTIVNSAGGITSFNNGSYAIPRSYHFDNCIIRVTGKLFRTGSSSQNADKLEGIYFNNTVIAPYSGSRYAADGSLIDFSTAGSDSKITDNVNIGLSYCTVYEYGTTTNARGLMAVADCGLVQVDHSAFYHSSYVGANVYTLYASKACTAPGGGIEVTASFANLVDSRCQTVGNKGNITNSNAADRKWSGAITQAAQTVVTEAVDASKDYFPVQAPDETAGAKYDTKYWVQ